MREIPPTGANLREQATLVIESFTDRRLQLYDCELLRRDLLKLRVEEKSYGMRLTSPRDGDGHGDTFSAFSLALLIGHELAGKKPVRVGVGFGDPNDEDSTPFAQAWRAFEERQADYEQEQEYLSQPTDDQEPIRNLFRQIRNLFLV